MVDSVRARPSETGSRASAKPASGLDPAGFDPARWAVSTLFQFRGSERVLHTLQIVEAATRSDAEALAIGTVGRENPDKRFLGVAAIATEARRAATTGAVDEGAAPQGDRPNTGTNPTPQSDERIGK